MSDATVEVRLLGRLSVRRIDGTFVENNEWRTGKTADLLRVLALAGGRPVSVAVLLDRLWPDVSEEKGRASLRTAASQIRRTVGSHCIERWPDGLALANAWVDAAAYSALVREVREVGVRGQHAQVVRIAREAEALYAGDLEQSPTHDQPWLSEERDRLRMERQELLTEAAGSACALGWSSDAMDFAHGALECDPLAERPHRTLMTAYAGLGEAGQALRTYEQFRQLLADELGADPSPQTQALYMEILCGSSRVAPLGGQRVKPHTRYVEALVTMVQTSADRGRSVITLSGPLHSGRCALLASAVERLGAAGWRIFPLTDERSLTEQVGTWGPDDRTLVVLPNQQQRIEALQWLLRGPALLGTIVVAFPKPEQLDDEVLTGLQTWDLQNLDVGPLSIAEVRTITTQALGSPLTDAALAELLAVSGRLFGHVDSTLAQWLASGRLTATTHGLDLGQEGDRHRGTGAALATLRAMSPADLDVAATLAVLRVPTSAERLAAGLTETPDAADVSLVRARLDRLVDAGVLTVSAHGYRFRDPQVRDTAEHWLRPTRRVWVHRRFAACEEIPSEERARHWLRAGEPVEALETLLDAATHEASGGRRERAAHLLHYALRHARGGFFAPGEQRRMLDRVASTAARLDVPAAAGHHDGHEGRLSLAIA